MEFGLNIHAVLLVQLANLLKQVIREILDSRQVSSLDPPFED